MLYTMNGFKIYTEDDFFGAVTSIEVDNVYDDYIKNQAIRKINENKIEHYSSGDYDLSILKYCPSIKHISISGEADLSILKEISHLEGLSIGYLIGENAKYDFGQLKNLKKLKIFEPGKNISFLSLNSIEKLEISYYTYEDFSRLSPLKNLKSLRINTAHRLKSLKGIEVFKDLENLTLDYCLKLEEIDYLKFLCETLKHLNLIDCNKIQDLQVLSDLKYLETLKLCASETLKKNVISSVKFIANLRYLKSFMTDYKIVDMDLAPLLRLDEAIILKEYKGYNLKADDLPRKFEIVKNGDRYELKAKQ